jgi:lipoyl-dependent peroxiredoxin
VADRRAEVTWKGDLINGSGTIDEVGSGALGPLDVSWAARSEDASGGKTSPEELIAAAHAACFSMALSNILAEHGHAPDSVRTVAQVHLRQTEAGPTIQRIDLETEGRVPGIDQDHFAEHAEEAKQGCPVSRALAGVEEMNLTARLAG